MTDLVNYKKMYHTMVHGSEKAIKALEGYSGTNNYPCVQTALSLLTAAQLTCEDIYVENLEKEIIYLNT